MSELSHGMMSLREMFAGVWTSFPSLIRQGNLFLFSSVQFIVGSNDGWQ